MATGRTGVYALRVTEVQPTPTASPTNGAGSDPRSTPASPRAASSPTSTSPGPQPPVFGRLESVQLRRYWQDEARHFTPWLAKEENLTLLGEAIGMSLELVATEQYIGPFRADIIAQDEDAEVIIENQLDATDHRHLGQLMVYAANRGSGVIVWIARQITDEYRKVIDWLNEKTDVSFFALELELWRIGNSPVAPKFNIVCKPNVFARAVRESASGAVSATAQLQLEFWNGLVEVMSARDTGFNQPRAAARHWCDLRLGTGRGHVGLTALRNGRLSCELYMGGSQASLIFQHLEAERPAIEAELGLEGKLEWQPLPDRNACRIAIYKEIGSLDDREQWPTSFAWMLDWAEKFRAVFAQRLKDVVFPEPANAKVVSPTTQMGATAQLPSIPTS